MEKFSELREKAGLTIPEVAEDLGYTERNVYRWENGKVEPKKLVLKYLKNLADNSNGESIERDGDFKFIDLFAGIGGMRKGFEKAGGQCVFTSEIDKFCRQTYVENFEVTHRLNDDIKEMDAADIPEHDLLLAGFPCQPFSIAGVSKKNSLGHDHGFLDETKGTLFFDIARILKYHRPAAFLLENVKNLKSHEGGKTFEVIRKTLEIELDYNIDWKVIDAKGFVPQHRERLFIAGFRKDTGFRFKNISLPTAENGPKLRKILHPEDGSEDPEPPYTEGKKAKVNKKYTLSNRLWTYLQEYAEKHRAKGNGFGFGLVEPDDTARTLSARYYKDGSEILVKQEGKCPRRLTPRECSRLMGFDSADYKFRIPVSDTQAYQQFGNAVVVPVVKVIAEAMKSHIIGNKEEISPHQIAIPLE